MPKLFKITPVIPHAAIVTTPTLNYGEGDDAVTLQPEDVLSIEVVDDE